MSVGAVKSARAVRGVWALKGVRAVKGVTITCFASSAACCCPWQHLTLALACGTFPTAAASRAAHFVHLFLLTHDLLML